MKYISTRGDGADNPKSFEEVLLAGLAPDGGLYVPTEWPSYTREEWQALAGKPYVQVAKAVMMPFVEGSIDEAALERILADTYGPDVFDHHSVAPLMQMDSNLWLMELYRGPTLAFKDVALQLLGRLFDEVLKKRGERVTIVGATSGDTGSAAIEGCKACDNVDIFILHPKGRVSEVQRRQMTTVQGENIHNIALEGTFDDCQNMVKAMFNDPGFRGQVNLSAINSINWARIMGQVVYYATTALALGAPDKKVSFVVPTGNFGNVFAAYVARQMGLPIEKLIISTNKNDILTRFFETGEMKMAGVSATNSPSMDIEISSNFERYLFELIGRDHEALRTYMSAFKENGSFTVSEDLLAKAKELFLAGRADDEQTLEVIRAVYAHTGFVIDPHTATGMRTARPFAKDADHAVVSLACAHPAKFPDAVEAAIGQRPALPERLSDLLTREEFLTPQPNDLAIVQGFIRDHARITRDEVA